MLEASSASEQFLAVNVHANTVPSYLVSSLGIYVRGTDINNISEY